MTLLGWRLAPQYRIMIRIAGALSCWGLMLHTNIWQQVLHQQPNMIWSSGLLLAARYLAIRLERGLLKIFLINRQLTK